VDENHRENSFRTKMEIMPFPYYFSVPQSWHNAYVANYSGNKTANINVKTSLYTR